MTDGTATAPTYVNLRVPATERRGVLCLRVTDFRRHKNEVVHRVLPKRERIVVTAMGYPDFEVVQPDLEDWERQDWDGTGWWEAHEASGRPVAPVSYFMDQIPMYAGTILPTLPYRALLLTRYGWPDFVARQPRWKATTKVRYEPVVDRSAEWKEAGDG